MDALQRVVADAAVGQCGFGEALRSAAACLVLGFLAAGCLAAAAFFVAAGRLVLVFLAVAFLRAPAGAGSGAGAGWRVSTPRRTSTAQYGSSAGTVVVSPGASTTGLAPTWSSTGRRLALRTMVTSGSVMGATP